MSPSSIYNEQTAILMKSYPSPISLKPILNICLLHRVNLPFVFISHLPLNAPEENQLSHPSYQHHLRQQILSQVSASSRFFQSVSTRTTITVLCTPCPSTMVASPGKTGARESTSLAKFWLCVSLFVRVSVFFFCLLF